MAEKRPWYKIQIDLRAVWFLLCIVLWLAFIASLLDARFYWERYPRIIRFLYPSMEKRWWTEHWLAVWGVFLLFAQGLFAYLLHMLSQKAFRLTLAKKRVLFFAMAGFLGIYASCRNFQQVWLITRFHALDIVSPLLLALTLSLAIAAVQRFLSGPGRRLTEKAARRSKGN